MPEAQVRRRSALRAALRDQQLDALLVTNLRNVRYLTGFTGTNAALLVHAHDEPDDEKRTVFCTDGRYATQSEQQVPDLERVIASPCELKLTKRANDGANERHRLGVESNEVTVRRMSALTKLAVDIELVDTTNVVEQLRMIKDEYEIEALRLACAAGDQALEALIEAGGLRPGRTEQQVANDLEFRLRDYGATDRAFDLIVAAGPNSAIPHHPPSDAVLRTGDLIKLDFGALVDGYHSDMTRTFVLGRAADWQRELYQLVADAQAAGRAAVRPGVPVAEVDAAARSVIEQAGYGEQFLHPLGHGVGLDIHEAPLLSKSVDATLAVGMAVTVEPGVYLVGQGGVRIEDTLVVREGTAELLTLTGRDQLRELSV